MFAAPSPRAYPIFSLTESFSTFFFLNGCVPQINRVSVKIVKAVFRCISMLFAGYLAPGFLLFGRYNMVQCYKSIYWSSETASISGCKVNSFK
jgi:hypothetical protein